MDIELIAPSGMNCGICSGYLAHKHDLKSRGIRMSYCIGCRPRDKKCAFIKKRCSLLQSSQIQYCYECGDFPCRGLQSIDRRYRTLFRMSLIGNLECIKNEGIQRFLEEEVERWQCPECGAVVCCHNGICFNCGLEKLKSKEKLYRWGDE